MFRLFVDRFGTRTALWGTVLLAFNPASYVFSMAYTEAAFLLLAGLYFLDRYGRLSPVLAGLAMLFRVAGLAIAASATVMFFVRATSAPPAIDRRNRGRGLAVWWLFIWQLTGNFGGLFQGSAAWAKYRGPIALARAFVKHPGQQVPWFGFVVLMVVGTMMLLRRHPDLAVYGLVAIGLGLVGGAASSMPRYCLAAFPAFAAFAERLGPRGSLALTILFVVGEALYCVGFAWSPGMSPP